MDGADARTRRNAGARVSRLPVLVIVGRPNVGKSTLFNRLTRSRRALVHDLPGVTRDRIVGDAERPGGGRVTVIDTGGLLSEDEDRFLPLIRSQAETALEGSDAVVFLLDGNTGLVPEDRDIAHMLRTIEKPVVIAINKADRRDVELQAQEFHRLGLGEPIAISAEHGTGIGELWDALDPALGPPESDDEDEEVPRGRGIQVAIVGRPNVGKSSLLNRLAGESRVLVSEVPGTTRDAVDVVVERHGQTFCFIDTAGIRRKGKTDRGPEVLSVVMARRHLERADVCLFLVDAIEGITRQDAHVAGYAWEARRSVALIVNKWDLVDDRATARRRLSDQAVSQLKFLRHAPSVYVSALTGSGVHKLYPMMQELHRAYHVRSTTSELNRILHQAWDSRPPPMAGRKAPRFFYAVQVHSAPPSFALFTNLNQEPHFSYMRYLENVLRETLGLAGVPIRVMIRGRKH